MFRRSARMAFAVINEWSDMNACVSGTLVHPFWAIAGNTARADGKGDLAINPYGISVRQIFVPGGLTTGDFKDLRPVALNVA